MCWRPGAGLLLVFVAGAAARVSQIHALKRDLRQAFANSLPRAAIDRIARDPSLLSLEGETRTITYLACGMRGLTELSSSFRGNPKGFTRLAGAGADAADGPGAARMAA